MIASLLRAEWQKTLGNRRVTALLIWIFPAAAAALVLLQLALLPFATEFRTQLALAQQTWTGNAIGVWGIPPNAVGRLILMSFIAVVFGGEYQWRTWKNLIPRRRRSALILAKFVVVAALILIAFGLTTLVWSGGQALVHRLAGVPYGPAFTPDILRDFARDYLLRAGLAFVATMISAGYAAVAALQTRSILGGVLAGLGLTIAEESSILLFSLLYYSAGVDLAPHLYRLMPGYNLRNIASWLESGRSSLFPFSPTLVFDDPLPWSLAIVTLWILSLLALTLWRFQRQDIG